MGRNANDWDALDFEVIRLIAEKKASSPIPVSNRAIARAINVSPPRVADLFNGQHGSPSLREIVALCGVFDIRPSTLIEEAMDNVEKQEVANSFDLAAKHGDTMAEQEAYEEEP